MNDVAIHVENLSKQYPSTPRQTRDRLGFFGGVYPERSQGAQDIAQGRPHRWPFDPSAGSGQARLPSTEFTPSRVEGLRTGIGRKSG